MKKYKHISAQERDRISLWFLQGIKIREIAKRLNRSPGTISDEIKRNKCLEGYISNYAQALASTRQIRSTKLNRLVLKNLEVQRYVFEHLRDGWSPEQISGRLKIDYPNNKKMRICHESIYQYIYSKKGKEFGLWEYLPWKQKKRKKHYGRKTHRSRIPHRVSIHKRSQKIDKRLEFGHWEGDSIVGKGRKQGIHTEVERMSRFLEARKMERIASEECIKAQLDIFSKHPQEARKSTTLDNGREHHLHEKLKILKMKTYFCDPYSSWQRGTNEYHNGLIRRYLPKNTDFNSIEEEELQDIVFEINSRPRKILNFKTPLEVYNAYAKCSAST